MYEHMCSDAQVERVACGGAIHIASRTCISRTPRSPFTQALQHHPSGTICEHFEPTASKPTPERRVCGLSAFRLYSDWFQRVEDSTPIGFMARFSCIISGGWFGRLHRCRAQGHVRYTASRFWCSGGGREGTMWKPAANIILI